jgi:hypothetical protein
MLKNQHFQVRGLARPFVRPECVHTVSNRRARQSGGRIYVFLRTVAKSSTSLPQSSALFGGVS